MEKEKLISALTLALFISLAGNVFASSHFLKLVADSYWSDKAQDYSLRQRLKPDDRAALEAAVEANRKRMDKIRDGINAARDKELAATKAEPFDKKGLDAALNEEKEQKMKALLLLHETRQQAIAKMSPEGRSILQKMKRIGFATAANMNGVVKSETATPAH